MTGRRGARANELKLPRLPRLISASLASNSPVDRPPRDFFQQPRLVQSQLRPLVVLLRQSLESPSTLLDLPGRIVPDH